MIRDNTSDFVKRADAAMEEVVLQCARQHNTPIVVWRDGKVVELDPFSEEFDEPTTQNKDTTNRGDV